VSRAVRFLPLVILLLFVAAVAWRLINPRDEVITSKLAGKPVPAFGLEPAIAGRPGLNSSDLAMG